MTAATEKVREQSFSIVDCDVPPELTLAEYRPQRKRARNRRSTGLIRRRRGQRSR